MSWLRNSLPPVSTFIAVVVLASVIWFQPERKLPPAASLSGNQVRQGTRQDRPHSWIDLPDPGSYDHRFLDIAGRPLFSENRRPPQSKLEADAEPPLAEIVIPERPAPIPPRPLPNLVFQGFIQTEDQLRVLIQDVDTGEETWIAEGDLIKGWQVRKVSEISMELQNGDDSLFVEAR